MRHLVAPMLILPLVISAGCATTAGTQTDRAQGTTESPMRVDNIAGYGLGHSSIPPAPLSLNELDLLWTSVLFTDEDIEHLRLSRTVLEPHVKELVGVWYGFVGANPHLLASFSSDAGEPDAAYLERVRARFERWVLDTADARYDQDWLDYQFEIGRRHHRVGKNTTDNADASAHIAYRYVPALMIPVTTTLRPFLERGGHDAETVDKMHAAWVKSVQVQAILWSYPYVRAGDF